MLVINGRNGKSVFLANEIVRPYDMIIETSELPMSRFIPEQEGDEERMIFQLPSNSNDNVDAILKALTSHLKEIKSEFEDGEDFDRDVDRFIFYLNLDLTDDNIQKFVNFENQFNITVILTTQSDNNELEFYNYSRDANR